MTSCGHHGKCPSQKLKGKTVEGGVWGEKAGEAGEESGP